MVDDVDTKVSFAGLTPGRLYNVTVWTVSDNVESRPLLRQDRLCEYPRDTASVKTIPKDETLILIDNAAFA